MQHLGASGESARALPLFYLDGCQERIGPAGEFRQLAAHRPQIPQEKQPLTLRGQFRLGHGAVGTKGAVRLGEVCLRLDRAQFPLLEVYLHQFGGKRRCPAPHKE